MNNNLKVFKSYVLKNNGITVLNNKIKEYKEGYQVATSKDSELTFKSLDDCFNYINNKDIKSFGLWLNDNIVYLDINSIYIKDYNKAIKTAKKHHQKAIFDWSTKKDIIL